MRDLSKVILFIGFIIILWCSGLYLLNILFIFPLLMDIGNFEYIPRAIIALMYLHLIQRFASRLSRRLKTKVKYEKVL